MHLRPSWSVFQSQATDVEFADFSSALYCVGVRVMVQGIRMVPDYKGVNGGSRCLTRAPREMNLL